MSNVLSISTFTPKVSAWPSTFHTGRMNAAGEKGTFIFYCDQWFLDFGEGFRGYLISLVFIQFCSLK